LLNVVKFTRVGTVNGSPTIRGDTGYSEIPASRVSYFGCDGYLGPEFRPGKIAMSSD